MNPEFKNEQFRYQMILEGRDSPHVKAVFAEIEELINQAEISLKRTLKEGSDAQLRNLVSRVQTLKDALNIPEDTKKLILKKEE